MYLAPELKCIQLVGSDAVPGRIQLCAGDKKEAVACSTPSAFASGGKNLDHGF